MVQANPKSPNPKPPVQWMLQIDGGRVLGPLKTEDVIFRISEGILTGNEKIRKYPDGQWTTVSREPLFYDHLLEVLQKAVNDNKVSKSKREASSIPQKVNANPLENKSIVHQENPQTEKNNEERLDENILNAQPLLAESQSQKLTTGNNRIQYFNSTQSEEPIKSKLQDRIKSYLPKGKSSKLPFLLFALAAFLAALSFYTTDIFRSDSGYVTLKIAKAAIKITMDEAKQRNLYSKAYELYSRDQVPSYLEAQELLVQLIEGNPQLAPARGLLCLVHKELWPFAKQDSRDIDVFQNSRKAARLVDPLGENGIVCEITFLMILGKYQNAMGLADHFTNNPSNQVSPLLYLIKAELYAADKKYKDAIAYANDVTLKHPNWAKASYMAANFYEEINQIEQAKSHYQQLLKVNNKHRSGLIDYGSMTYTHDRDLENSLKLLIAAEKLEGRIAKSTESKMHFFLSRIYLEQKKRGKAIQHAHLAYQHNPGNVKTRDLLVSLGETPQIKNKLEKNNELVLLGDQYYRAGDCLSAAAEYMAAFEFDPQNAIAATKAGRCLWQLSQIEKAFLWLTRAISADPKLTWPYYLLADYYSQRYSFNDASQILAKALQKMPNNAEILKGYGLIEFRRNNFKSAIAYFERSRKSFENDPETLVLLSRAYSARSTVTDYEKALQMALKAIELEDTNSEAHVSYAKILVQTKGVEHGALYMKELVKKYSYNQEFRICLAQIYKEAERFNDAKEIFENAILVDDKNKQAMLGLGESYQGLSQFNQAIAFYLKAAVLDPSDPEPLIKTGQVFLEAGRHKEAIIQFERAKKLNPNYPLINYMLGRAAFSIKDFTNAIKYAANEKVYNPNLAEPYLLSGEIYFSAGDFAKCAQEYEKAVKLRPQGAENYVKLAVCHLKAGNIDIAESMLTIASQQESGFADIHKIQGEIFEKRGERDAAIQSYSKYITLSPNAPDKRVFESRIESLGGGR